MPVVADLWDTLNLLRREAAARGDSKLAAMFAESITRFEQENPTDNRRRSDADPRDEA